MSKRVAIVGASSNREKYGNKAVRAYADSGWIVFPVNPKGGEIEGHKAYQDLESIPEDVERISVYLSPDQSLGLLDSMKAKRPEEVFFNPGAESDTLLRAAEEKGLHPKAVCSIVAIGRRPDEFPA